jgi:hypothetical protein
MESAVALDTETTAFLALDDFEQAAWTPSRAAERGLDLPPSALPGVIENVTLLRAQTAFFVSALQERVGGDAADETPETFQL